MKYPHSKKIVTEIYAAEPGRLEFLLQFFDYDEIRALLWSFYEGMKTNGNQADIKKLRAFEDGMVEMRTQEMTLSMILERKLITLISDDYEISFSELD